MFLAIAYIFWLSLDKIFICKGIFRGVHILCGILQLQPNSASGSGALEHDPSSIYLRIPAGEAVPGPLPLGVSVIDASVALFGVVFPHVSYKHRSVYIYIQSQNSMRSILFLAMERSGWGTAE